MPTGANAFLFAHRNEEAVPAVSGAIALGAALPAILGGPLVDRLGVRRASVGADWVSSATSRSIDAVTTRPPAWRIAETPAQTSIHCIITPPNITPAANDSSVHWVEGSASYLMVRK